MKYLIALFFCLSVNVVSRASEIKFSLQFDADRLDATAFISLNCINYNTDKGSLALYEVIKKKQQFVATQLESGHCARLWFILKGITQKGSQRNFVLKLNDTLVHESGAISIKKDEKDLQLSLNGKSILSYRHATTLPPDGIDPLYKRSAYIHPLRSPGGEVLTHIQPADHYHHYGIWGPWTKTHIDGREVDFWNLAKGHGTVKFSDFIAEEEGSVYSGFRALQQHIDFGGLGEDKVALNEILDVRAWNIGEKIWIIDYTTSINSPLENGIMLDAYRYGGGIGFRATERWHKDNCTVLTSNQKTRVDADGSFAKWCKVEGESDVPEGRSGILFLSHPSNRMHPEPMRVWPMDANGGRGDLLFEFVPIRHTDWKLEAKRSYTLKYRMVVFDGELDVNKADMYWNSFATNPKVVFKE